MWFYGHQYQYRDAVESREPESWKFLPKTLDEYMALYDVDDRTKAVGEASPDYYYHPHAMRNIQDLTPGAKLVLILRDPMDRAYSAFQMMRRASLEPCHRFEEALHLESQRIEEGWHFSYHYLRQGLYARHIRRIRDICPDSNLLVLFQEELRKSSQATLQKLFKFVGVDDNVRYQLNEGINAGYTPRSIKLHEFLHSPSPLKSMVKSALPRFLWDAPRSAIQRLNQDPKRCDPCVRNEFLPYFHADTLELEKILSVSLEDWRR